ncbi:class I SAM-dependent methyltransferase [Lentilactobacillus diolivorans]|nr:SAM-dependent methyltransferase [Lentilactobacillus diolivorans]GEP25119.1 SAM-dependent methyltransferase [Lentilactobacillus diolivorans]
MNEKQLKRFWKHEERIGIRGWDFSHLKRRWNNEKLPWDYRQLVLQSLTPNKMLLDMGTGGGELLSSFHHPAHQTAVTEAWQPNIDLLRKKFEPIGVTVYPVKQADMLPVHNQSVDIITNSHNAFNAKSVANKLNSTGLFITQQVGATNNFSLSQFLNPNYVPAFPKNTLLQTINACQKAGLKIRLDKQAFPKMTFFDVGAIVYYASIIPWEFPNFSVDKCLPQLLALQQIIDTQKSITTNEDRFIVIAQKA